MIDIIIPSKWRPTLLRQAVDSVLSLAVLPTTGVIVGCDSDDPATIAEVQNLKVKYGFKFKYVICEPLGSVSKSLNSAFKASDKNLVGVICDDGYLTYPGWDKHVEELFIKYPKYGCLRIRTSDACNEDSMWGIPYPFTFVVKHDIFKKMGYLEERYNHFGPDTHFGMQMVMEDVLMMTSKHIILQHFEPSDSLHQVNKLKHIVDNHLFFEIWNDKLDELQKKYQSMKENWNLIVE